jgi:integrase
MGRKHVVNNAMAKRRKWIESFPSGLKWINCLPSATTKLQYCNYLQIYCDAVKKTPEELLQLKVNGLKLTGENEEFQAEELLENYLFNTCKLKPNAKLSLKNAVFSFYKWNRRALEKTTASAVKTTLPEAKNRNPTLEDIKTLEENCTTKRDKAIVRFVASTAFRVGTITKLKWCDLKPTEKPEAPFYLEIEASRLKGSGVGKYKGLKHIAFVNWWAYEMLQEYKKEAELKGYIIKDTDPIFIRYYQKTRDNNQGLTTKGLFQLFDASSLRAWNDIEEKKFSPHDLRSFYNSALESTKLNENVIAPLMAHKPKGIAQSYSEHTIKELLESYVKALPFLIPKTVSALENELKNTESKFRNQQQQIEELREKMELLYPKQLEINMLNNKGKIEKTAEKYDNVDEYLKADILKIQKMRDKQRNVVRTEKEYDDLAKQFLEKKKEEMEKYHRDGYDR